MKEKLSRFIHPSADMKKAIDRNAKQDEDLSLVLKQIDIEKRIALDLLSRKQDAFKQQILKRRENVISQRLKVQVFGQKNVALGDQLRPHEMERVRLRRTLSCEETSQPSMVRQRAVLSKRNSLPPSVSRDSDSHESGLKTGGVGWPRGTVNESIRNKGDTHPEKEDTSISENNKQKQASQSPIRRHSDVTSAGGSMNNNARLLQRRRVTMHSFMRPGIENEVEALIRL